MQRGGEVLSLKSTSNATPLDFEPGLSCCDSSLLASSFISTDMGFKTGADLCSLFIDSCLISFVLGLEGRVTLSSPFLLVGDFRLRSCSLALDSKSNLFSFFVGDLVLNLAGIHGGLPFLVLPPKSTSNAMPVVFCCSITERLSSKCCTSGKSPSVFLRVSKLSSLSVFSQLSLKKSILKAFCEGADVVTFK